MTSKSGDFAGRPAQPAARLVASKIHALPGTLWPTARLLHLTALPPAPRSARRAKSGQVVREFRSGVRRFVERLAPFPSATGVEKVSEAQRSGERRVGEEGRSRWLPDP